MDDDALRHLLLRSVQLRKALEEIESMIAAHAPHLLHPKQQQQELQQQQQAPGPAPDQPAQE